MKKSEIEMMPQVFSLLMVSRCPTFAILTVPAHCLVLEKPKLQGCGIYINLKNSRFYGSKSKLKAFFCNDWKCDENQTSSALDVEGSFCVRFLLSNFKNMSSKVHSFTE